MTILLLLLACLFLPSGITAEERSLLADQLIGREFTDTVQSGDPLTAIGARVGVDAEILAATNHLAATARLKPAQ